MKKYFVVIALFFGCFFFTACNTATPEKYFNQAVLNSNMMMGFAGNGMERQLEQPTAKMVDGEVNKSAPMKRKEIVEDKIKFLEEALSKVRDLKETADAKAILQASLALHEFVLPVYKNEYLQLAKLYDENAPKEQVQSFSQSIHDKYFTQFEVLYRQLIADGKLYAAKHNINVHWND
ncbi:MAG: hypothetical protein IPP72_21525 [Chitinophagaceae bacterium]|nr:hypothetical protein [Chitinophagaceae bacterium]